MCVCVCVNTHTHTQTHTHTHIRHTYTRVGMNAKQLADTNHAFRVRPVSVIQNVFECIAARLQLQRA